MIGEVIVIDDGSIDDTHGEYCNTKFQSIDDRFPSNFIFSQNKGKGYAVRTGMIDAKGDWMLLCDADLAAPIEEVDKLFAAHIRKLPLAVGR